MRERVAVFPGSFDPFTNGHLDIVQRALPLFDTVIVAIGVNSQKQGMFSVEQRIYLISQLFDSEKKVKVESYDGLTVDFCKSVGASHVIRGLRNTIDFEYEKSLYSVNTTLESSVDTVFFMCKPEYSAVSSIIVRDLIRNKKDVSSFIPFDVYSVL